MATKNTDFVHLHVHSEYSLLDGAIRIKDLPARLQALGMSACALTDHGNLFGAVEFYQSMEAAGLQAIIGAELYVTKGSYLSKGEAADRERYHIVVLAENNRGLANLYKLMSASWVEGFYYKPRVDHELLKKYHEGLIALSGCLGSEINQELIKGDYEAAKAIAAEYRDLFGKDNFFIELQANDIYQQKLNNQQLKKIAAELDLPLVATNDAHYLYAEDAEAHDVLLCMQTNSVKSDPDRFKFDGTSYYIKSREEMYAAFRDCPQALSNTVLIKERCKALKMEFGKLYLPEFPTPDNKSNKEYLRELAEAGLQKRLEHIYFAKSSISESEYRERLYAELNIINNMNYTDYFLIVQDFINYARNKGIPVGPGRGSGAASLVAYSLRITDIDPLTYNLLFERFLNPERVSMPDFDIDFCYERRQEVIDYVADKYGKDHVCQVITFGTLAARACLRDVLRVLGYSPAQVSTLMKPMPSHLGLTLATALEESPDLKKQYEVNEEFKQAYDMARKLEGLPRHSSTHAAGVIISGKEISDVAPLARNDNMIVVQYNKDLIEQVGLLKFDFLGLRTLTVISDAIDFVKQRHGKELDFAALTYDDPAVYKMIAAGDTSGVFQLESAGMTSFMKALQPVSLEDLIAGISLFRPGPMKQIPNYIKGRHNQDEITYLHPALEKTLKVTYGAMVYQEQVMQIVRDLAGFSLGQSDIIRKAMAKKKKALLERYENLFIYGGKFNESDAEAVPGAVKNGVGEAAAKEIFAAVLAFAGYAFNKAHAAGYAVLAYQTAWLKHYYPLEFMTALLNSFINSPNQLFHYIKDCREQGIKVSAPDVNSSQVKFMPLKGRNEIAFALGAVRNVGLSAAAEVVRLRERSPYVTFFDFLRKMHAEAIGRNKIEALIWAGALDAFPGTRLQKILATTDYLKLLAMSKQNVDVNQMSLFSMSELAGEQTAEPEFIPDKAYSSEEKLAYEKQFAAVYFSGHPLDNYQSLTADKAFSTSRDLHAGYAENEGDEAAVDNFMEHSSLVNGSELLMYGLVQKITQKFNQKQEAFAILKLEDAEGEYEALCFAKVWSKIKALITENKVVMLKGKVSVRGEFLPSLLVDDCRLYSDEDLLNFKQMYAGKQENLYNGEQLYNTQTIAPPLHEGDIAASSCVTPTNEDKLHIVTVQDVGVEIDEHAYERPSNSALKPKRAGAAAKGHDRKLYINLPARYSHLIARIGKLCNEHRGPYQVLLYDQSTGKVIAPKRGVGVSLETEFLDELIACIGTENIVIR